MPSLFFLHGMTKTLVSAIGVHGCLQTAGVRDARRIGTHIPFHDGLHLRRIVIGIQLLQGLANPQQSSSKLSAVFSSLSYMSHVATTTSEKCSLLNTFWQPNKMSSSKNKDQNVSNSQNTQTTCLNMKGCFATSLRKQIQSKSLNDSSIFR